MEGCSKYCSFCVVPYTRGEEISRPFDDILTEIAGLAQQGIKEITLLGQNVNAYRGKLSDGDIADFAMLLEYVHEIPGLERLRFSTSHPREFTERLIDCYRKLPKLVSHVHLPIQSGSDRTLAAMKRGYTTLEYKSIIRKLRALRADICLTSDFIVGFPGETEADFEATLKLARDLEFDLSYVFIYSPRPGTPAASLPDDVSMETKKKRLNILQERIMLNAREISGKMVGTEQPILVTGLATKYAGQVTGRTENNRVVNFTGSPELIGQMVPVIITEAVTNSLRGKLAE